MKRFILSLLIVPLFFSCQKADDQIPENNGPVFVTEYENNYGTFKLSYNAKNILSKVEYWTEGAYSSALYLNQVIEYNYSNDKLTGYTTRQGGENTPPGDPVLTSFVFDDKGHITQSVSKNVKVADWKTNADGKPTARIISNGPSYEWEYTTEGNIKFHYQTLGGSGWSSTASGSLSYHADSNPFYTNGTGMALYAAFGYVAGSPAHLIPQNLVSNILSESTMIINDPAPGSTTKNSSNSSYTYTKDANGLLKNLMMVSKKEEFLNGVKTKGSENSYTYKFTCIRK
ncbi:MAG: hypothetical protein J7578_09320 [Chitinophagaceae bacterium]|nr:hypothetical protein [Chitinophagaceae bacterium]